LVIATFAGYVGVYGLIKIAMGNPKPVKPVKGKGHTRTDAARPHRSGRWTQWRPCCGGTFVRRGRRQAAATDESPCSFAPTRAVSRTTMHSSLAPMLWRLSRILHSGAGALLLVSTDLRPRRRLFG